MIQCYPWALAIVFTNYVGNFVGEGDIAGARKASKIGVIVMSIVAVVLLIGFPLTSDYWVRLFYDEPDILAEINRTKWICSLTMAIQNVIKMLSGILKVIGYERRIFWGYITLLLLFGQGLCYYLAHYLG